MTKHNIQSITPFKIIGIATRTSNTSGKAAEDVGALWGRFFEEQIGGKIPEKVSEDIFAIYTDYESDYTGEYTCLIGYQVGNLENVAEGLVAREFEGGQHIKFVAAGKCLRLSWKPGRKSGRRMLNWIENTPRTLKSTAQNRSKNIILRLIFLSL